MSNNPSFEYLFYFLFRRDVQSSSGDLLDEPAGWLDDDKILFESDTISL